MAKAPTTSPKPFCFVLMPFSQEFDDVYQLGIKEACAKAGAYCERVDEQIFHESILDRVYNQIAKADFIIADMTGRNPNVFYEVGYAHALGTPTILLTQDEADIPFDLKHFPHIVYGSQIVKLKDELRRRVKWFVENPTDKHTQKTIDIDLFLGDKNLSSGDVIFEYPEDHYPDPYLTIHNASSQTFEPGSFKLGVKSSARFNYCASDFSTTTPLPHGGFLHMLPDFQTLFPDAYTSLQIILRWRDESGLQVGDEDNVVLCVFTSIGSRDYPLTLRMIA